MEERRVIFIGVSLIAIAIMVMLLFLYFEALSEENRIDVTGEVVKLIPSEGWFDDHDVVVEVNGTKYVYSTSNNNFYSLEIGDQLKIEMYTIQDQLRSIENFYWDTVVTP